MAGCFNYCYALNTFQWSHLNKPLHVVMKVQRTLMESRLPFRQALRPVSLSQGLDTKQCKQRKRESRRKPGEHAEP